MSMAGDGAMMERWRFTRKKREVVGRQQRKMF